MREFLNSFSKLEFDKVKRRIHRYAVSAPGQELVSELTPSSSVEEVRSRLSLVTETKRLLEEHGHPPLDQLPDVRMTLQRVAIENFILPPEELYKIALLLEASQNLTSYFKNKKEDYPLLSSEIRGIHNNHVLQYNITQAIDENAALKDSATKELKGIRRRIIEKKDSLRAQLESILRSLAGKEWAQEEIITTRDGRLVIPVKTEHKNRVPGFIHSSSSSGATVYIEPSETLEANNDLRTLQFQEQREVERILKMLSDQVREVRTELQDNMRILGKIDFFIAKAKYSVEIMGSEPIIKEHGRWSITGARHPILLSSHKRDEVVPLDLNVDEQTKTIIVTGPNAGGKSVALKTVGLLSVMLQSGCHVPASSGSEFIVFKELFVDIGDEQSIENDLSSFSSHLRNLNEILQNVSQTSLILLDEIGSGTDPMEGASIAAAVLERLTQIGCTTIATTHHGTLKTFAFETPHIENAAMEFDHSTLLPTYRFRLGVPGSSYAIEMAQRTLSSRDVVERAKELRGSDAYNLEKLITDLELKSQTLATAIESLRAEKSNLGYLINLYQKQVTSLEKELKSIKQEAILEADAIVLKAKATIEKAVQDIRSHTAEKKVVKAAQEQIDSLRSEIDQSLRTLSAESTEVHEFAIADFVKFRETNLTGQIIEKIDSDHYQVLIGDLKVRIHRRELELSVAQDQHNRRETFEIPKIDVKRELDLRGMRGDEAILAVDKVLDDAVVAGIHRIDIIHGKGTGALRKRIGEYLKAHGSVKTYRLGEWNEGGSGVTVVELS